MSSITGVADCCRPSSQGEGWPRPAKPAPVPARTVTLVTTKAINRLSTCIVLLRSLDEKSRRGGPLLAAHRRLIFGTAPLGTALGHGRGSVSLSCGGTGEIPVPQTTIPALLQCT